MMALEVSLKLRERAPHAQAEICGQARTSIVSNSRAAAPAAAMEAKPEERMARGALVYTRANRIHG